MQTMVSCALPEAQQEDNISYMTAVAIRPVKELCAALLWMGTDICIVCSFDCEHACRAYKYW